MATETQHRTHARMLYKTLSCIIILPAVVKERVSPCGSMHRAYSIPLIS